ncbi:aminoglycoside phosphotransferase family protein [Alphaproteobacteria bacterium]|nr:aminoglycoside phosphotransferase family protein [Alphaproteobacteria bacterium]
MRIGIDFDNTIACYDKLFHHVGVLNGLLDGTKSLTKVEVKRVIQARPDGDKIWQKLQGQVYGPFMEHATMFPGLGRFLLRAKHKGHNIYIISHKTEFGHFDKTRTLLRQESLLWMERLGFFDSNYFSLARDNVFFESTRKEKVTRIADQGVDVMIDDLREVFDEPHFPKIKTFLFGADQGWHQISEALFGVESDSDRMMMCQNMHAVETINSLTQIQNGRNSCVFTINTAAGSPFVVKFYPDRQKDSRERLHNEVTALDIIKHIQPEIKTIKADYNLDIGIFSRIDGQKIEIPNDDDINSMLNFVDSLFDLSKSTPYSAIGLASESCLCAKDILMQIDRRIAIYSKYDHPLLKDIMKKIKICFERVKNHVLSIWPNNSISTLLSKNNLIISPSDFGFHNAIRDVKGKIIFLDFEYFGWDDPVKLCIDTILHPGMHLAHDQKVYIAYHFHHLCDGDPDFKVRFQAAWPLYRLRWGLILLNSLQQKNVNGIIEEQYKKAISMIEPIFQSNMECPYV